MRTGEIEALRLGDGWADEPEPVEPQLDAEAVARHMQWVREGGELAAADLDAVRERHGAMTLALDRVCTLVELAQTNATQEARAVGQGLPTPIRASEQWAKGYDEGRMRELQRLLETLQAIANAVAGRA